MDSALPENHVDLNCLAVFDGFCYFVTLLYPYRDVDFTRVELV